MYVSFRFDSGSFYKFTQIITSYCCFSHCIFVRHLKIYSQATSLFLRLPKLKNCEYWPIHVHRIISMNLLIFVPHLWKQKYSTKIISRIKVMMSYPCHAKGQWFSGGQTEVPSGEAGSSGQTIGTRRTNCKTKETLGSKSGKSSDYVSHFCWCLTLSWHSEKLALLFIMHIWTITFFLSWHF